MYTDATPAQINEAVAASWQAFQKYKSSSLQERAALLRAIAAELAVASEALVAAAQAETHLQKGRLQGELARTQLQLRSYADACERGNWLDIRIDTANSERQPPKPDLRKTGAPLGPVVVFGASNFPFAYSTAGGDTACALAAGCTVVVKGHPAHPQTSELAAEAIWRALAKQGLSKDIFQHVYGSSFEAGKALVLHPQVKAVGFTGSLQGGRALFNLAAGRTEPIPVFAEMGSVNPVFLMPQKLSTDMQQVVDMYAASITVSAGQFCTNPGLIFGIASPELDQFIAMLAEKLEAAAPEPMLNPGIAKSFKDKRGEVLASGTVRVAGTNEAGVTGESIPTLAVATGEAFLQNQLLHQEVFGPYSLVVQCSSIAQMQEIAEKLEGQLTATLMATEEEAAAQPEFLAAVQAFCGRFIFNGVPTGVEVALAMHHGGPYPASTDSRFTSVGADGIKRFTRPISFQNCPDAILPPELQNKNPLGLWRTVNDELTQKSI
jgi:NADP-dependent aldehyde dehydrogenase